MITTSVTTLNTFVRSLKIRLHRETMYLDGLLRQIVYFLKPIPGGPVPTESKNPKSVSLSNPVLSPRVEPQSRVLGKTLSREQVDVHVSSVPPAKWCYESGMVGFDRPVGLDYRPMKMDRPSAGAYPSTPLRGLYPQTIGIA